MGILSAIVQSLMMTEITSCQANLMVGGAIRAKLISHHNSGRSALARQQFAKKTLGSLGITVFLHNDFKSKAILINGRTQKVPLTFDGDNKVPQMLFVTKTRRTATDVVGIGEPEFLRPFAHCFMSDNDPSISQYVFNHAKA